MWEQFAEPKRDRWGRPLIIDPDGGAKLKPYTRVSTLAKTLDDQSGLMRWMQRQVAIGIAHRADLLALARATDPTDKRTLADLCEQAMAAAGASSAANTGTALHSFTEAIDNGHDIDIPAEFAADLTAYRAAMEPLHVVACEQFVVIDELEAAGSFDRLVTLPNGQNVIADIKTGKDAATYATATAAQMALYARGKLYDPTTGRRVPLPGDVSHDLGLLIHLPAGAGTCSIYKVDLAFGWLMATVATEVRGMRKAKPAQLAWSKVADLNNPGHVISA